MSPWFGGNIFKYAVNVDVIFFATLSLVYCRWQQLVAVFLVLKYVFYFLRPSCVKTSQIRGDERADAIDRWKKNKRLGGCIDFQGHWPLFDCFLTVP
jgi:hypothetical protein